MRCKKCGNTGIQYDIPCNDCGTIFTKQNKVYNNDDIDLYNNLPCQKCGKTGRRLSKEANSEILCFFCYHKKYDPYSNSKWNESQLYLMKIIRDDILIPQFYGQQPDYTRYESILPYVRDSN